MNDLEHNNPFWSKTALALGALLLGGYAAMAALAVFDQANRPRLEVILKPTAVGDPAVYVFPADAEAANPAEPVLTYKGAPLFANDRDDLRDSSMMKAGTDDAGKIPLYRRLKKKELREELYLKLAPGEYLELRAAPRKPKAAEKEGEAPAADQGKP